MHHRYDSDLALPELPPGATMPPRFDRLVDYLAHNAAVHPDTETLVDDRERLTWSTVLARCDRYAAGLLGAGIGAGDRVAVWSVPRIDALLLYLACIRIGAVFVAVDPRHSPKEASFILGDAEPTILFHIREFEGQLKHPPRYITKRSGGAGFKEVTQTLIRSQNYRAA